MGTQFYAPRNRIERDSFASAASKTKTSGLPRQRLRRVNPQSFCPLLFLFRSGFFVRPDLLSLYLFILLLHRATWQAPWRRALGYRRITATPATILYIARVVTAPCPRTTYFCIRVVRLLSLVAIWIDIFERVLGRIGVQRQVDGIEDTAQSGQVVTYNRTLWSRRKQLHNVFWPIRRMG